MAGRHPPLARAASLAVLGLGLGGCSGASISVTTTVPTPLVEPIPLAMGLRFDDTMRQYVHEEDLESLGKFRIELGSTQVPVFERVFAALFERTELVDSVPAPAAQLDGIIAPTVEELQFSIPEQTKSGFFEVWIKYKIEVYSAGGELLGSWPLPAYGKSHSQNFGFMEDGQAGGLNDAAIWALRDAAAHIAFHFAAAPEVQALSGAAEASG